MTFVFALYLGSVKLNSETDL